MIFKFKQKYLEDDITFYHSKEMSEVNNKANKKIKT